MNSWALAAVAAAIARSMWIRRHTWQVSTRQAMNIAILLIATGLMLCAPPLHPLDVHLQHLIGVGHVRDYAGHLCFLCAAAATTFAVASRLVPDDQVWRFMRRIEAPNALAGPLMLICMLASPVLKRPSQDPDFFAVHCDAWLRMYWTVYASAAAYQMFCLTMLLLVLRTDPRSRRTANLFLVATITGICVLTARTTATFLGFAAPWLSIALVAPPILVVLAAAGSWRRRIHDMRGQHTDGDSDEGQLPNELSAW